jgi:hypothetical protein
MDRPKQAPVKQLPLKTCPACGGTWFQAVHPGRFLPLEQALAARAQGNEAGCISQMQITVLVCLCGTPFRPSPSGVFGVDTWNAEIASFYESFACADRVENFRADWAPHERESVRDFVPKQDSLEVCRAVSVLERWVGRLLAARDGRDSQRGGRWRVPKREAASKSKGRDWLALELQKCGLTYDEAREVLGAILDSMVEALREGEWEQTPIGEFQVKHRKPPYLRTRFGRADHAFPFEGSGVPGGTRRKKQVMSQPRREPLRCPRCGSTHFYTVDFQQYLGATYSSSPGGELYATGPVTQIRVCLCGKLVTPAKRLSLDADQRKDLSESVNKAQRFRRARELETLKNGLRESFASRKDLLTAIESMGALTKVVEQAEKEKKAQADQDPRTRK